MAATKAGYYFKSFNHGKIENVVEHKWKANHVWNDAIVYTPHGISNHCQPMIWDLFPTVLHNMGISLPDSLDGQNLLTANADGSRYKAQLVDHAANA